MKTALSFRNKPAILCVAVIILIGILVYANALTINCFHYDDDPTIVENPVIRDITKVVDIFKAYNTRFLVGFSFALNFWLGGLDPFGYRLFNIIIHILSSIFVYAIILLLYQTPILKNRARHSFSHLAALFSSLIFLTHPVQIESVTFLTQRFTSLATFFYLAAFLLYLKGRFTSSYPHFLCAFIATVLAMFCKENTVTIPIMLIIAEICFWGSFRFTDKKRILILSIFCLTLIIIPLALLNPSSDMISTATIASRTASLDPNTMEKKVSVDISRATVATISRKEYFFTEINVMLSYARLFLCPVNLNIDYDYPISPGLNDPKTLLSGFLILLTLYYALKIRKTDPLISFGILWFFITLGPESSLIPIGYVIAEHRLYLPIVGFSIIFSEIFMRLLKKEKKFQWFMVIVISILSLMTIQRNSFWKSRISLLEDAVKKSPHLARLSNNLGILYTRRERYNKAIDRFYTVIRNKPEDPSGYTHLGYVYMKMHSLDKAIAFHKKAIQISPGYLQAYVNLGATYATMKDYKKEIEVYKKALRIYPNWPSGHFYLGAAYIDIGDKKGTLEEIKCLKELGKIEKARTLERALDK